MDHDQLLITKPSHKYIVAAVSAVVASHCRSVRCFANEIVLPVRRGICLGAVEFLESIRTSSVGIRLVLA